MLNSSLAQEKIRDLHQTAASHRMSRSARRQQTKPDASVPRSTWGSRLRNRFAIA